MTAKEMFEKLGFEYWCSRNKKTITYELDGSWTYVAFLCDKKEIESTIEIEWYPKMDEINKAIHQQLKEFGWLTEE